LKATSTEEPIRERPAKLVIQLCFDTKALLHRSMKRVNLLTYFKHALFAAGRGGTLSTSVGKASTK